MAHIGLPKRKINVVPLNNPITAPEGPRPPLPERKVPTEPTPAERQPEKVPA